MYKARMIEASKQPEYKLRNNERDIPLLSHVTKIKNDNKSNRKSHK